MNLCGGALDSDWCSSQVEGWKRFPISLGIRPAHIQSIHTHYDQGTSPPHSFLSPSELPDPGCSCLHVCSLPLMPSQDKHKWNRSHTLQPMGRKLALFQALTSTPIGLALTLRPRPGPIQGPGLMNGLALTTTFPPPWGAPSRPWICYC